MKNYKKTVLILGFVYFLAVLGFFWMTFAGNGGDTGRAQDILILNDIVQDAKNAKGAYEALDKNDYGAGFVILDQTEQIVYASLGKQKQTEKISIETAIKKGYPYKVILTEGKADGTVILLKPGTEWLMKVRLFLVLGLCFMGVVILLGAFLFGRYVEKRIYRPFQNMKLFAGRIAEGNLETPLTMDQDNLFGDFTESFDIMREELKAARHRENALKKREKELVASLSHDLKTPITGIKLSCELLSAKLSGKEEAQDVVEKLENIYKKADQIDVLVTDLFSSTLEDLGEFKVEPVDESSEVLKEIIRKYDDRGLVEIESLPDVLIHIDRKRMSQVIGNIITNSYKYANTGIHVTGRLVDDYLEMKIKDDGPGVPEEELCLITNKFYRGKQDYVAKKEGSGLGLYIAKVLMEKMDGDLFPESKGTGLTITLLIPLS